MADDGDDRKVGKGRPPRHSQFKPGQSGNPAGRPKGCKNMNSLVRTVLAEQVPVVQNGQKLEIPRKKLLLTSLSNKASKGDVAALRLALSIAERAEHGSNAHETPLSSDYYRALLAEMDWLAAVQTAHAEGEDDEA